MPFGRCSVSAQLDPALAPSENSRIATSNDTIREIAKALCHHVDAATLEKVVNELLDVPGNRSFRDAIEELAREGISAMIWRLHMAAAAAHRAGYSGSTASITGAAF